MPDRQKHSETSDSELRVVRLGPTRFLSPRDELMVLSETQQIALIEASMRARDGGWVISGFVGDRTTEALRKKGLLTPHAYALSALGVEMRDFLVAERAR